MSDGKVAVDGSFTECVAAADGRLDSVMHHVQDNVETETKGNFENKGIEEPEKIQDEEKEEGEEEKEEGEEEKESLPEIKAKDEQGEKKARGVVSKETFFKYARSIGGCLVVTWLILLFAVSQAVSLACTAMIGRWSERSLEEQVRSIIFLLLHPLLYSLTYMYLHRNLGIY